MERVSHLDIQELLGVYALDAVEGDEAAAIEAHLPDCPRCRDELAGHREVAGLFAFAGQEAPAGLWDRITASMQEEPPALRLDRIRPSMVVPPLIAPVAPIGAQSGPDGATVTPLRRRRAVPLRVVAVLAAAAAAAVAFLGVDAADAHHTSRPAAARIVHHVEKVDVSGYTMADVRQALSQPGARRVELGAPAGGSFSVDAVVTPTGTSYLYDIRLAPLSNDRTYQLWGVVGAERISYGLLGADPATVLRFEAGDGVQGLAVTDEVASGVAVSSRPVVVSGAVTPAL